MSREGIIRTARIIGPWIPAALLVLIFARQGWSKFSDTSGWSLAFRVWGYPDWFRIGIGVAELLACALLLLGRTAAFGGLLIVGVMLGGTATHVVLDQGRNVTSEVVPIILATIVIVMRRKQLARVAAALRLGPARAGLVVVGFLGVAIATPAFLPVQAQPEAVSLLQFQRLTWLTGAWRGSGTTSAFFEEYRTLNDSTIAVRTFADSSLSTVRDSSIIGRRGGIVVREGARSAWVGLSVSDTSVRFVRKGASAGGYTFTRLSADVWTTTIHGAGTETVYEMRRVRP